MRRAEAVVVTVFPDDNKKYLSTDLLKEEPRKPDFISSSVELLRYNAFKRVCYTCCNPDECVEARAPSLFPDEPLLPCPEESGLEVSRSFPAADNKFLIHCGFCTA